MKRVGLAVGFVFLALVASEWFANSAFAETPKPPPLTSIQEDDAVPEIAKYKRLYERVTASDWQPAVTVTASVGNGKSKRYPKADFFCKQIKSTADIQFAAKPKPGTLNFASARITSIDCASQPGAARMTGVFVWNNGEVWVGEISFTDQEFHKTVGFTQALDKSIRVYRASSQGAELVAVAGAQGATLLATGGDKLFGFDRFVVSADSYYSVPHAKVRARLIIPSMGYLEGRSSSLFAEAFRVGAYKLSYPNAGYGAFYAPDDGFRIIGPIWNEGQAYDPHSPSSVKYAEPDQPEGQKPETLAVELAIFCADGCSGIGRGGWFPTKNYFYMASCAKGIPRECDPIRIETRIQTILGPPGSYEYKGVVDLTKAPDLSKMLSPKWGVNVVPEPLTFAQHFQKIDQPAPSQEQLRQAQARRDRHFQTRLEAVEAYWAEDDKRRIDFLDAKAKEYSRAYAQSQADLLAERQAEARKQAATAAAIMGAFADLSRSAIGAAEDLNQSRALVDRTNAASAGGGKGSYTPYVAPPLTAEQRQLLASKWGRSGGKSVAAAGSRQGSAGRSVSGSNSASEAESPKRMTQEEAEAIMTSRTFVTEDGSTFVTNGAFVQLETLASDRFWSLFMVPLSDMEVTSFRLGSTIGDEQQWNMQGRGVCTHYLDMRPTSAGIEKTIDPKTGKPWLVVEPCTWNFANNGTPRDAYILSTNSVLKGWSPK